jgi:hypothetical protein
MVGWRFEVGGDWFSYLDQEQYVWALPIWEVLAMPDPGYQLLNWVSGQLGWGFIGANVIGGLIFAAGLVVFCRQLPRPWLAFTVAVPYLVIVVAMGYARQGIALALAMIGLVALEKRATAKFVMWVFLGATVHKTAVLLLPLGALAHAEKRFVRVLWVAAVTVCAYLLFLADSAETLYVNYIEAQYQSEGAFIRLLMNAVPAAILIVWRKRFNFAAGGSLWRWFAWLALGLLAVLLATPASTAVDRIALYVLPLQLVVFSRLPDALATQGRSPRSLVTLVVCYYAAVLFVWLNYATHAEFWIPYRFYPLEVLQ